MKQQFRYVCFIGKGKRMAMIYGEKLWDTREQAIADIPPRFQLDTPWKKTGSMKPKYGGQSWAQRIDDHLNFIQAVYVKEEKVAEL